MAGDVSGTTKRRVTAGDSSMALVVASKRRGRPPKSDLANLFSQRGRPLKPVAAGGRRGRPPKMAILADAAAAATELTEMGDSTAAWRAGRRRKVPPVRLILPTGLKLGPASMLATLSSKRQKPGRPRRGLGGVSTGPLLKKQKLGRPKKVLQPGENMMSGHVDGSVGRRKPGRPAKANNSVSGDVEGSGGKRRPGRLAKVANLVSGDLDGSVRKRTPGRPAKITHPVSGLVDGSVGKRKRKLGWSSKAAYPLSGDIEGSVGKRKTGRPSKVVHPVSGVVEGSVGMLRLGRPKKIVHPVSGDVEGSVGKKQPRRPAKIVHALSGDVEQSAGKRKPGRPAKVAKPTFGDVEAAKVAHPESGDVEGSTPKRKPGRPAKVVELEPELGLTLVTSDGETPIEKRKSRPSQKLLQLSFGSKNGAAGSFTRKRKRGRASVGVSFFEATNGAAEVSSGKKQLGRLQPGSVSGAGKSSSRKPGRPKKVVDGSVDKKLSRPRKIMKQGLNSAIGSVEASAGKRKQGRPRKIVLPDLNSIDGAVKISDGSRKPRQLKKALLPDLNLTSEDVLHLKDTDQHAGAMGSVDGQMKMVLTQVSEFPDGGIMFGSVSGLPKESANGEGDTYINNGNLVQPQKDVQTDLNEEVTKGRVVVNGGTTLMNSSQSSIGKRKLGRPKKLSQVDEDTTLLTQMQTSHGKLVGVAELAPDPVPAAVDVLLGMRNPGTGGKVSAISSATATVEDGGDAFLNPVQESADNTAEGLKLGLDGPVALTMPIKLSSAAMPGNGNVMMLNPVLSSPGEVGREVEIVMPTFKRRGRPVKKSR